MGRDRSPIRRQSQDMAAAKAVGRAHDVRDVREERGVGEVPSDSPSPVKSNLRTPSPSAASTRMLSVVVVPLQSP